MKLVFVIGELSRGGAETHLSRIAPLLFERGVDVTIFTLSRRGELANDLEQKGISIVNPPSNNWFLGQVYFLRPIKLLFAVVYLFGFLVRRRDMIVHFFLPMAYLIGGTLSVLLGAKSKVMSRRSLNVYHLAHPIAAKIERWLHKKMDGILANSKAVFDNLIEEGVSRSNCKLIYNGIDFSAFDPKLQQSDGNPIIISVVANLIPYKGHADLLQAVSLLKDSNVSQFELRFWGYDGGIQAELEQLAAEYGITERVHFCGSVRNVADQLRRSDIGLLASHEEGFSNAILEYMAAGLPVIATDVGGNAEAVLEEETGLIIPAKSPEALALALKRLIGNRELRNTMGKNGRLRVESLFSIETCVEQYISFYQSLDNKSA